MKCSTYISFLLCICGVSSQLNILNIFHKRVDGRQRGGEEAVCDNVVDFQMQRTSFAFQNGCSGNFWLSLFVVESLSASATPLLSLSLSLTPSLSLFFSPLSFFCFKIKFALALACSCLAHLLYITFGIYCAYASLANKISKLQIFIRLSMIYMTCVCVCECVSLSINCCLHKATENFAIA